MNELLEASEVPESEVHESEVHESGVPEATDGNQLVIEIDDITVAYKETVVFDSFSEVIEGPTLCSIIGANGTGKTTLLRLICGTALPRSGDIRINGMSTKDQWSDIRNILGSSLYAERSFHFRLTGLENLIYFGRISGFTRAKTLERLEPLRKEFSIEPLLERKFMQLSLGQRKIFGMIVAFLLTEKLVVLDEPTATLDEANTEAVIEMMQWAVSQGITVVTTTHHPSLVQTSQKVIML